MKWLLAWAFILPLFMADSQAVSNSQRRFVYFRCNDGSPEYGTYVEIQREGKRYKLGNHSEIEILSQEGTNFQFRILRSSNPEIPTGAIFLSSFKLFEKDGRQALLAEEDYRKLVPRPASQKGDVATPPFVNRLISEGDSGPGCYDEKTKKYRRYKVALTFDDGPAQGLRGVLSTQRVIEVLRQKGNIKAVFFISGERFDEEGKAVRHNTEYYDKKFRLHREGGHYLANHTWYHKSGTSFGADDLAWEDNAVRPLLEYGERLLPALRLPYGDQCEPKDMREGSGKVPLILKHKMIPEYWTIDSEDYKVAAEEDTELATKKIIANVLNELCQREGGIILLHDIHPNTARALGPLVDALRAEGHEIVHPKELRPRWFDEKLNQEFQSHVQALRTQFQSNPEAINRLYRGNTHE